MRRIPRDLEDRIARTLLRTPRPVLRALFIGRRDRYRSDQLDLRAQLLLRLERLAARRPLESLPPEQARVGLAQSTAPFEIELRQPRSEENVTLAGVPARVYRGGPTNAATMMYFHGGGFVVGSVEAYDRVCRYLAVRSKANVVSIDYRLCPEHPYPAGHEDARTAFDALNAGTVEGVHPGQLMVAGDSAGGNLAAHVAQHARDRKAPLALQYLVYPTTDLAHATTSYRDLADRNYLLTRGLLEWFSHHMPMTRAQLDESAASPLKADLSGLCPAVIVTAGFDPLLDEGLRYAEALRRANVPVDHRHFGTMMHGFINFARVFDEGRQVLDDMANRLAAL